VVRATVSSTGTLVNTAFTTTTTPETNGDNNHASAKTLVVASATPPLARPLATVEMCRRVTVGTKMVKANGKEQTIRAKVTQGAKGVSGVSLRITGPGVSRMVRSGANGVVLVHLTTRQPGILKVAIVGKKACDSQRIGVVGTYEPPVTG